MSSIDLPGVDVIQEFVTDTPTAVTPTLSAWIVGPAFRVISAFDDDGDPQSEALAGTYQDGNGTVAYDLPSIGDEDDIDGFEDDIRVFLLNGSDSTELNGESDEVDITSGTTSGAFAESTNLFEDGAQVFTQVAVAAGDIVRITYLGNTTDVPIASVDSDTELTLEDGHLEEDLSSLSYTIVRNPAEFVYGTEAQAYYQFGDVADYFTITAQDDGDYAGSAGDGLTLALVESEAFEEGTDGAYGASIFGSSGVDFTSAIGGVGEVTGDNYYVVLDGGSLGTGDVLRQVSTVVSAALCTIETGESAGLSSQSFVVGKELITGTDGATNGGGTTLTSSTGGFLAAFGLAVPGAPSVTSHVEIDGDGIFTISNVTDTVLTISGATGSASGLTFTAIEQTASDTDGTTGATTDFVSASGSFVSAYDTDYHLQTIESSVSTETNISAVPSGVELTAGSALGTSGVDITWKVVASSADLSLSWDPTSETIEVQLARSSGTSSSTYADIEDALTNDGNAAYSETIAGYVTAALGGTTGTGLVALTYSDVGTYAFDGGADDDQLVLDADLNGSETPTSKVYVSYKTLRVDLSAGAADPEKITIESTSDIEDEVGDITTDNPLAVGLYLCKLNAPTSTIYGIGVGEVSSALPDGTVEAYTTALEFLEGQEAYAIALLTQNALVHQVFKTHITSMSSEGNKSERIGLFSQVLPTYEAAEVIASGTEGNTGTVLADASAEFSTSVNLTDAEVEAGDFLVVTARSSSDDSPDAVNGTQGPLYGIEIDSIKTGDDFVAVIDGTTSGLSSDWNDQVDVNWTIYRVGDAITKASDQSEAVANIGEAYASRRMYHVWGPEITSNIDSTDVNIEGHYLAAMVAGWITENKPAKGLTNESLTGATGVKYSSGYFSKSQLNRMAGGGTMIFEQRSTNGPLICRHQLSTDTSSVNKRELNITKALDYTAKFYRGSLSKKIGKFNITQSLIDSLAVAIKGLSNQLVEAKVLLSAELEKIEVNDDDSTQLDVVIVVEALKPLNYIRIVLEI